MAKLRRDLLAGRSIQIAINDLSPCNGRSVAGQAFVSFAGVRRAEIVKASAGVLLHDLPCIA
jgi:hypothetical protein